MSDSHEISGLRNSILRTASIVCLLLVCTTRAFSQCPPRPRIPDPPGWAIDTAGENHIFGYQLSGDGNWFAFNSGGTIWLMNVHTGERKQLLPCIEVSADAFAFAPDSSLMAFGTGNGVIYLFEIPSGALRAQLQDDDWVQHLKFGPAGLIVATRSDGISVWNSTTYRRVSSFSGEPAPKAGRVFGSISTTLNLVLTANCLPHPGARILALSCATWQVRSPFGLKSRRNWVRTSSFRTIRTH